MTGSGVTTVGVRSSRSALLTDLYQLTMAQGYWRSGRAGDEAVFHLFFRTLPFRGGYAIAAGLASVVERVEAFRFEAEETDYLATLEGNDGQPLFETEFLAYLRSLRFEGDLDALPEGTVCFPHEPLLRMRGPIVAAQILETALLNVVNFQTLVATKAARVCQAARGEPVLEFGLRRAQGVDGALSASRAAYLGGCASTSNVLAGQQYGIPVKGTHAHSWVMLFESELEAFQAYARAMPNNCVFLVDTYDTLRGVERAIEVGRALREGGHELVGIRLDSGDLAALSIEARRMLDGAGFESASIVASNDLDEGAIEELKERGARIGVWGVGTKLATCYDQPALGGVYKLAAVRAAGEDWRDTVKLSEDPIKVSIPGIQQVRRYCSEGRLVGDAIHDERLGVEEPPEVADRADPGRLLSIPEDAVGEDLLVPIFRGGKRVYEPPPLEASRDRAREELERLPEACRRLADPELYPVGIERRLAARRQAMVECERESVR